MKTLTFLIVLGGSVLGDSALAAQSPPHATAPWHIPFQRQADGTHWAAGQAYKVRIGDDVTFYPRVASDAHQPLRWRTHAILVGTADVTAAGASAAVTPRVDAFRLEYARGLATEIYEVRADGLEQSFRVARPAQVEGDLVVVGRTDGALHAVPVAAAHQALTFRNADGDAVVTYGAATAIDAAGRRLPLSTEVIGDEIRLRVPAAWLADAVWPVTVDPLLARVPLPGAASGPAAYPQVVRSPQQNRLFVAEARPSAGADWDLLVRAYDDAWTPLGIVYSQIGLTDTRRSSLAYVAGPDRLLVAVGMQAALQHSVRVYVHDAASLVANSGTSLDVPRPANTHDSEPCVGGSGDHTGFLVFRRDQRPLPGNSDQSRAVGVLVDAQALALGTPAEMNPTHESDYDVEHPRVSEYSETGGWVAVWQQYENAVAGDDWDVVAQRIAANGSLGSGLAVGQRTHTWTHKLTPQIAGSGSRFAVVFVGRPNDGSKTTAEEGAGIYIQRLDWPSGGACTPHVIHAVREMPTSDLRLGNGTRTLSYDHVSDSLWAVAWERLDVHELDIGRYGYDERKAELRILAAQPPAGSYQAPALCFDSEGLGFAVVYASSGVAANDPLQATRFLHGAATAATFGVGCAGTIDAFNAAATQPYAGSEFFGIALTGGRSGAPTVLVAGGVQTNLPLPGAPGCFLYLDPTTPLVILPPSLADAGGDLQIPLPIPSGAAGADLLWQFLQWDAGHLWASNALSTHIR